MDEEANLIAMQRYVANIGITASTLRGLGVGGFVKAARDFLATLDLGLLVTREVSAYPKWLDDQTNALKGEFPKKLWGPARKSINIFMTMATLNRFLCREFVLERLENALEVPLDSVVISRLREFERGRDSFVESESPTWKSIKALDPTNSEKFQKIASKMAEELRVPRGRLDIELWQPVKT